MYFLLSTELKIFNINLFRNIIIITAITGCISISFYYLKSCIIVIYAESLTPHVS